MSSEFESIRIGVGGGTPGADSNDYTLFDSTTAMPGFFRTMGIARVVFTINNSQAGTLKASFSTDKGTNWTLYDQRAVAAYSSPSAAGPFDYLVDPYPDFRLVWTNGGVAQATWLPALTAIRGDRAAGI